MTEPAVSISTKQEGMPIEIDGVPYVVPPPSDTPLESIFRHDLLAGRMKQLIEVVEQEEVTSEATANELADVVRRLSDRLLRKVPAEVREKLSDSDRLSIVTAYGRRYARPFVKAKTQKETLGAGGGGSSPDSADSTAEATADGGGERPQS